jgi:alpha-1,2-mannosyltransferase
METKARTHSFLRWLTPELARRVGILVCQIMVAEYSLSFVFWYAQAQGLRDSSGTPLGADFLNIYAAGKLALAGHAPQIYDWVAHGKIEQAVAGYPSPYFGWHYPPMFIAAAAVLAVLPYLGALALYLGAGFAAYVTVLRGLVPRVTGAVWAVVAFPGVFTNIINGQNAFITTALFGAGFLFLETAPLQAGVAFGLLAYKPQFFAVIPLMLAIGKYWRTLLACLVTAAASAAASELLFGNETWAAFFDSTRLTRHIILEKGSTGWQKIQSVFSAARMLGCGIETAYVLQAVVALGALTACAWVWRRGASLAARAGSLCATLLLTTPYALDYDLAILAVPIALLARQGCEVGFSRDEKSILCALWLLPLLARFAGRIDIPLTPPLMAGLLVLCVTKTLCARFRPAA